MMWSRRRAAMLGACAALAVLASASGANAAEPFYKGKRLTLLINFAPGGPTDIEGRLVARHIAKHIAGHPSIIVQNKEGAGGLVGTNYMGELAPKDGTMFAYLTSPAWRSVVDPQVYHFDFKTFEFVGRQPGNAVYYVRTDLPPGMKQATDIMKEQGLVAAGLAVDTSKDLLLRLSLDMLGLNYRYITGYRSSNAARLAVQRNEASMHSESTPGYFAMVEPSMVKKGEVMPVWYDPSYDGKSFHPAKVMEGSSVLPFPDFYKKVKGGGLPSGILWDTYRANLAVDQSMLRAVVLPPGAPQAAVKALRDAMAELNNDKDFAADAMKTMQFVPFYDTGDGLNERVRSALVVKPEIRTFVNDYLAKARSSATIKPKKK
jgi:tripartite-type tricarboxylate transporter receptor subunit TctC